MAAIDFPQSLSFVLRSEGGYSDDPRDPGGATMNGITQREYDIFNSRHGLPHTPVRNIHPAERDAIYRADYWDAISGDKLAAGFDYCVFDAAVNSGAGRAKLWESESSDIDSYCNRRLNFLEGLGAEWRAFGSGWTTRIAFVRRNAKAMAGGQPVHDIAWVQAALNKLGSVPSLAVDGVDGALTVLAIKKFQAAKSLTVDGLAGPMTVAVIEQALGVPHAKEDAINPP